jgi:DNA-binding CsgD family transcriptional regulator
MNRSNKTSSVAVQQEFFRVAEASCALCTLPSVPTHDWTTCAAAAISRISGGGPSCVMIVHQLPTPSDSKCFSVESVGISLNGSNQSNDATPEQEETLMRVRLERVQWLGFALTSEMLEMGVVGRLSVLNRSWRESGIGQAWAGIAAHDVLISAAPVADTTKGLFIICMSADSADGIPEEGFGAVASILRQRAMVMLSRMGPSDGGGLKWLTPREQEVLDALVEGHSVRVIADVLGRSRHTVHDHVKSLHKKIHASSRGELVAAALGHGDANASLNLQPMVTVSSELPIAELKPVSSSVPS